MSTSIGQRRQGVDQTSSARRILRHSDAPSGPAFRERYAHRRGDARSADVDMTERVSVPATRLDRELADRPEHCAVAVAVAVAAAAEPLRMVSGAAHDTMFVAPRVPSAMVFVPCEDGVSHAPQERADTRDVALSAEIMLNTVLASVR